MEERIPSMSSWNNNDDLLCYTIYLVYKLYLNKEKSRISNLTFNVQ